MAELWDLRCWLGWCKLAFCSAFTCVLQAQSPLLPPCCCCCCGLRVCLKQSLLLHTPNDLVNPDFSNPSPTTCPPLPSPFGYRACAMTVGNRHEMASEHPQIAQQPIPPGGRGLVRPFSPIRTCTSKRFHRRPREPVLKNSHARSASGGGESAWGDR